MLPRLKKEMAENCYRIDSAAELPENESRNKKKKKRKITHTHTHISKAST
jgi:hypothetical protein